MTARHVKRTLTGSMKHRPQKHHFPLHAVATPSGFTASGFADPTANGALAQVGTINGQPLYQSAGGWYFGWMGTPPGWWAVQAGDPRVTGFNGVYYRQDPSVTGQYVDGGTSNPAGVVT
jgi:hypothetical protein